MSGMSVEPSSDGGHAQLNLKSDETANFSSSNLQNSTQESHDGSLYPIAVLIDELRTDDAQVRLRSIEKLSVIARALGPQRTREELLPFISDQVHDEDDVLLALAERLGELIPEVGGNEYAHSLLSALESLAVVEESVVRDKALESMNKIAQTQNEVQIEAHFLPLLLRLAKGEWFTSRSSSCGLFACCYPKLKPNLQKELRSTFQALSDDDTPMVRRACISKLGDFVRVMDNHDIVLEEMVPTFTKLCDDDQDSVRLLAVECVLPVALAIPESMRIGKLWQFLESMIDDKSWRVRYMFVQNIVEIMGAVNFSKDSGVQSSFVDAMDNLLKDPEQEVRTIATSKLCDFATALSPTGADGTQNLRKEIILEKLLGPIQTLGSDASQHVRTALADVVLGLAPLVGTEQTQEQFLPLYLHLLKDECAEVRLNVITNLHHLQTVIPVMELIQNLLPAIVQLAEDGKWRVRLAIIEHMPLLAQQLGQEVFEEKLVELVISWLNDNVYAIRDAATINIEKLCQHFGDQWTLNHVMPPIITLAQDDNYLRRLTAIFTINRIYDVTSTDVAIGRMLPILTNLASDKVANVRFNVAKTLGCLVLSFMSKLAEPSLSELKEKVSGSLTMLANDVDADVKFFAEQAIRMCAP